MDNNMIERGSLDVDSLIDNYNDSLRGEKYNNGLLESSVMAGEGSKGMYSLIKNWKNPDVEVYGIDDNDWSMTVNLLNRKTGIVNTYLFTYDNFEYLGRIPLPSDKLKEFKPTKQTMMIEEGLSDVLFPYLIDMKEESVGKVSSKGLVKKIESN